jgi:hypothetical protein
MTDRQQLESLLGGANGGSVTLPRKQAQELAQKLRARGGAEGLTRLEQLLQVPGDVEVNGDDARTLLEELRASGRRWVFGANEPRELAVLRPPEPQPEPVPEPQRGFLARWFGRGAH